MATTLDGIASTIGAGGVSASAAVAPAADGDRMAAPADATAPASSVVSAPLAPDMPNRDLVARAVQDLLASARLRSSPQLCRFLEFVAAESLAGRGSKLKAFTIATAALGRPADFDSARDPIVRVEATRLRALLAAHYAQEGSAAPVRIRIPPGSYQPVAEFAGVARELAPEAPAPAPVARTVPPPRSRRGGLIVTLAAAALVVAIVNTAAVLVGARHLAELSRQTEALMLQVEQKMADRTEAPDLTGSVPR